MKLSKIKRFSRVFQRFDVRENSKGEINSPSLYRLTLRVF